MDKKQRIAPAFYTKVETRIALQLVALPMHFNANLISANRLPGSAKSHNENIVKIDDEK